MSTVRETFGLACPKCGRDDQISIRCEIWVDVTPDGTERVGDDHDYDERNVCGCLACHYVSTVGRFQVEDGGAS